MLGHHPQSSSRFCHEGSFTWHWRQGRSIRLGDILVGSSDSTSNMSVDSTNKNQTTCSYSTFNHFPLHSTTFPFAQLCSPLLWQLQAVLLSAPQVLISAEQFCSEVNSSEQNVYNQDGSALISIRIADQHWTVLSSSEQFLLRTAQN